MYQILPNSVSSESIIQKCRKRKKNVNEIDIFKKSPCPIPDAGLQKTLTVFNKTVSISVRTLRGVTYNIQNI